MAWLSNGFNHGHLKQDNSCFTDFSFRERIVAHMRGVLDRLVDKLRLMTLLDIYKRFYQNSDTKRKNNSASN